VLFIDFRLPLLMRGLVFMLYIIPSNITVKHKGCFDHVDALCVSW